MTRRLARILSAYHCFICVALNAPTFSLVPIGRNWYGELAGAKNVFLKNRIACCCQSASCDSIAARTRCFTRLASPSGNEGLVTTSAKTSMVLSKSPLRQFADQVQELLPH